jgi:hypothetical protein
MPVREGWRYRLGHRGAYQWRPPGWPYQTGAPPILRLASSGRDGADRRALGGAFTLPHAKARSMSPATGPMIPQTASRLLPRLRSAPAGEPVLAHWLYGPLTVNV